MAKKDTITFDNQKDVGRVKAYDPYSKYASTEEISTTFILDDWDCQLVEPKHNALH